MNKNGHVSHYFVGLYLFSSCWTWFGNFSKMTKRDDLIVGILATIIFCLLILIPQTCLSEDVMISRRTQTLFARLCVNETGFRITDDAPAMAEVLKDRSSVGRVTSGIIIAYSRHSVTRRHETRTTRRYISFLNERANRPRFWRRDSMVHWSQRRQSWLEIYERAGHILSGRIENPCNGNPKHWSSGSRLARRARSNGYVRLECGNAMQDFWGINAE